MVQIQIDGKVYDISEGQNLLQACLSLGLDLPYFCWHPALGSVGACRQCAVLQYQDENDSRGRLIMGCMTPVADGQRLSLQGETAVNFRAGIIESLMTNHPHDCPVCEEGGACHLQDMTVMSGHTRRRFRGQKRTFDNQQLGPFIGHEMNRCITCYRCLRFYRDYAGGQDLHAYASRNQVYFGRFEDGTLDSIFSGNLIEVCPTGVFTDKPLSQHYSRKWDLQCAPSVCGHCSLGCNTSPGERYGILKRIQNRFHPEINGYFLCDRGRFGYGFVNHPQRLRAPRLRQGDDQISMSRSDAKTALQRRLHNQEGRLIGIGSPRATLDANYALLRRVGAEHFFTGLCRSDEDLVQRMLTLLLNSPNIPTMHQAEQADAVLILGEDLMHSAPRLALSVRQALRSAGRRNAEAIGIPPWQDQAVQIGGQNRCNPLFILHSQAGELDTLATASLRGAPQHLAQIGFAIAHAIAPKAPSVNGLSEQEMRQVSEIATALRDATTPLLIAGASMRTPALIDACEQIQRALQTCRQGRHPVGVQLIFPEANSLGLALLTRNLHENSLDEAFAAADLESSRAIILENDLYRRAPATAVDRFLAKLSDRIVIDMLPHRTAQQADMLLPSTSFAETHGVLINNEGRAQRLFPVYPLAEGIAMASSWLNDEPDPRQDHCRTLLNALADADAFFCRLTTLFPTAEDKRHTPFSTPRMPHRYSGRTAMQAQISVHEPQQPIDAETGLGYSMEGLPVYLRALAGDDIRPPIPFSWYPGWNSNQSQHKYHQEQRGLLGRVRAEVRLLPIAASTATDTASSLAISSLATSTLATSIVTTPIVTTPTVTTPTATTPIVTTPTVTTPTATTSTSTSTSTTPNARTPTVTAAHTTSGWLQPLTLPASSYASQPDSKERPLLLLPQPRGFGTEELSNAAGPIQARAEPATLTLHPDDAARRGIQDRDQVSITLSEQALILSVRLDAGQCPGTGLVPDGMPPFEGYPLPQWSPVTRRGGDPVIGTDREVPHA